VLKTVFANIVVMQWQQIIDQTSDGTFGYFCDYVRYSVNTVSFPVFEIYFCHYSILGILTRSFARSIYINTKKKHKMIDYFSFITLTRAVCIRIRRDR